MESHETGSQVLIKFIRKRKVHETVSVWRSVAVGFAGWVVGRSPRVVLTGVGMLLCLSTGSALAYADSLDLGHIGESVSVPSGWRIREAIGVDVR